MPASFIVTDFFDGRTIERLTKISTTRLARKRAQQVADDHGDRVSLIRIDDGGERHLVDWFDVEPTDDRVRQALGLPNASEQTPEDGLELPAR